VTATHEDTRGVRGARNQSLFRDINERVKDLNDGFSIALPHGEWLCECADLACDEHITLSMEQYERIRASGTRFAVAPEHVYPDIERVVERTGGYWVVEKYGEAGEAAAQADPRERARSS
jgi:hypothetical protein